MESMYRSKKHLKMLGERKGNNVETGTNWRNLTTKSRKKWDFVHMLKENHIMNMKS